MVSKMSDLGLVYQANAQWRDDILYPCFLSHYLGLDRYLDSPFHDSTDPFTQYLKDCRDLVADYLNRQEIGKDRLDSLKVQFFKNYSPDYIDRILANFLSNDPNKEIAQLKMYAELCLSFIEHTEIKFKNDPEGKTVFLEDSMSKMIAEKRFYEERILAPLPQPALAAE